MDDQRYTLASSHYPIVDNHIANDPTPKDQAIYVPSVTPGFAIDVHAGTWCRALPHGVQDNELNFLDPNNKLFRISHVMSSAGQALNQIRPCIITQRDRANTTLICDSGGYQIASGRLHISGDADRLRILRWMERHANYAMTLDVPTGPVLKGDYAFTSTRDCLNATLQHLDFFHAHRVPEAVKLLNVLQGNTPAEADAWYDAVKVYDFEGWAFAGLLRHNIYHLCRRLIIMAHENQLQTKSWIHVLGTCELDAAVLLTAVQRSINRHINPNLRISFDTSSPFRMLQHKTAYAIPTFDTERMVMPAKRAPNGYEHVGSPIRWPWPSALGDRMTLGDFCVPMHPTVDSTHDKQSNYYLAHHNLSALCWGIALANRVFDSESVDHSHTIAYPVGAAVEAIDIVLASGSLVKLASYQNTFARLRHGFSEDAGDEEREF